MGLFDNLFKKKEKETGQANEQQQPVQNTEDWDTYFTTVDDAPASIMVDLGLAKIAPVAEKPNLVWVTVTMKNPREDGLSGNDESNLLYEIEDNLTANIFKKHNAVFPGRHTADGKRIFYFYFGDTAFYDSTISAAMVQFAGYNFDYGTKADTTWDAYFNFLYPLPDQFQMIMNNRVIRNLESNGDILTSERMVDHWVYFKNETDTDNYIAEIAILNFKVLSKNLKDTTSEEKYQINIARADKVDYHSVSEYVLNLWQLAEKNNGRYDGWGCPVVKN